METRKKVLVVGLGEMGRALYSVIKDSPYFQVYGTDINPEVMENKPAPPRVVDILHICYPYSSKFIKATCEYSKRHNPQLMVINSTVPPGTTKAIDERCVCPVVHSPVRATHRSHRYMVKEIKRYIKFVGGYDEEAVKEACCHFQKVGLKTKALKSALETEVAKLSSTTYTAWMIVFYQELHRLCRELGASLSDVLEPLVESQQVHHWKPIWYPGVIEGHCIIPNTELLLNDFPDKDFLKLIIESNNKRKQEMQNPDIKRDVEQVKGVIAKLKKEGVQIGT